ncbi:CRISPR-associated protein Cas4 [Tepidimonas charontis]|uniref:CRISPR-associated exonuclease Cas4 n=1 Tax=Tepidimonas charontis TaxID=2267262 RepID=A0A554X8P1_9BURK|nr:CRISPR-associated protein Cas4 [Tepidimonas charontis]TSE32207.1 cas4: CRISPR-associated protein Cas4 [Tepidimonas charontis]
MNVPDAPIPISALQHWAYCPRQCGLIHLEQTFADDVHTARGQAVHRLVDTPGEEWKVEVRVERALPLWSDRLGLIGKADWVEFHPDGGVFPVEFKHGRKRQKVYDDLQLAAQAMCLEEMLRRPVPKGAIYHASSRRRREVAAAGAAASHRRPGVLRQSHGLARPHAASDFDLVRGKPRPSGRGRIARTAAPSYNGVAADNQGSLRQGMPEVTPVEIRATVAHSAQEPTEATHSGSMPG